MEGAGVVVKDPRFARLHSDPRFQRTFKRKLKIPIDSRFRHIFSDERFSDPLALDKRGRKRRDPKSNRRKKLHALHQYYHLDDDEHAASEGNEEEITLQRNGAHETSINGSLISTIGRGEGTPFSNHKAPLVKKKCKKEVPHDDEDVKGQEDAGGDIKIGNPLRVDVSKGVQQRMEGNLESKDCSIEESLESEDDSEESSESTSSSSEESNDEEVMDTQDDEVEDEKVPVTEIETRRLALVNMDWEHIRAVDILTIMNSFLPKGGQILTVSVYPSDFGLQQMKEEEQRGPQALFQSEGSDEDQEGEDGLNMEKLRQYEKDKLRYYYAVVECDSPATAVFLYKSCDGMEFERTSNELDLRFIPDDMEFKSFARDVATEVPLDYQAPMFETRALQHSRVKLTWDDDEPDRMKTLHQKFDADKLIDMDFKAYLASDTEEDEDEQENLEKKETEDKSDGDDVTDLNGVDKAKKGLRDKYRALLSGAEEAFGGKDLNNKDKDMEITFNNGLEELSKRLMVDKNKKKAGDETVWEAYLRKKKEKKKLQKQERGEESGEEVGGDGEHDGDFDDPFFNFEGDMGFNAMERSDSDEEVPRASVAKQKKGACMQKEEREERKREEERSRAELELLFADELAAGGSGVKGYNLKKKKNLKGKREDVEKVPDKLPALNYDDPRFAALFTSHRFALDPTEPEYKRSAAQLRSLLEKQQKHLPQVREVADPKQADSAKAQQTSMTGASKREKQEIFSIVKSLKRKVGEAVVER